MHPIRHPPIELTPSRSSFICGMHSLEGLERPGLHNEKGLLVGLRTRSWFDSVVLFIKKSPEPQ